MLVLLRYVVRQHGGGSYVLVVPAVVPEIVLKFKAQCIVAASGVGCREGGQVGEVPVRYWVRTNEPGCACAGAFPSTSSSDPQRPNKLKPCSRHLVR